MTDFLRYPHTPHLAWLGDGAPRNDKLLDPTEADSLLAETVRVEEKLDGANVGLSWGEEGQLRAQNRGGFLEPPYRDQFSRLNEWTMRHWAIFQHHLPTNLILFGEWCAARHSLDYTALPDWFLVFDVFDRDVWQFWNSERRDELARQMGLYTVPLISEDRFTLRQLESLVKTTSSAFREGPLEGVIIRQDQGNLNTRRAKLVHPAFTQAMDEHWRARPIEWNRLCDEG
ncbi:RNA ligase family protein [Halospina sp. K52047b]|uniref:RNA ligase family protein n=1 Tax=Halospina sp. K52047b TaxID=2614160 RepID=UPI00124ABBFE|nr:RNA ligase family protein [Halospina sp. K52047b]KAA8981905.1 DNA ligase [Halospina sp. K52047b]